MASVGPKTTHLVCGSWKPKTDTGFLLGTEWVPGAGGGVFL